MLILLVHTLLAHSYTFLQLDQSSKSLVLSGLESYSAELASLGDQITEGVSSLDKSIDAKLDHTYTVAASLLDTRINELKNEKSKLDYEIKRLNRKIAILKSSCSSFSRCVDCTSNSNCVWCSSSDCVAGDSSGPYQNECEDYEYSTCSEQSCEDFITCSSCTAEGCGWCDSTRTCFKSTASDSGTCEKSSYYHTSLKKCYKESDKAGAMTEVDAFISENPTGSQNSLVKELEEDLNKDYKRYAEIEEEIDISEYQKEQIKKNAEEAKELKVKTVEIDEIGSYESLLSELEEKEIEKSHSEQESILNEAGQAVIDYTDLVMENKTEEVIEAVQNLTDYYERKLDKIEKEYNDDMEEIQRKKSEQSSNDANSTDAEVS